MNPPSVNADTTSTRASRQVGQVARIIAEDVDVGRFTTKVAAILDASDSGVVSPASMTRSHVDRPGDCGADAFEHVDESPVKRKRVVRAAAVLAVAAELISDKVLTHAPSLHKHHVIWGSDRHITTGMESYEPAELLRWSILLIFSPILGAALLQNIQRRRRDGRKRWNRVFVTAPLAVLFVPSPFS